MRETEKHGCLIEGTVIPIMGNRPVSLDDPAKVWIVKSGRVDVFVVGGTETGKATGRRRHVYRAGEGSMLFGVRSATGHKLLASGTSGTELLEVTREHFEDIAGVYEGRQDCARGIDGWISALLSAFVPRLRPRILADLKRDARQHIISCTSASATAGVLWVCLVAGQARSATGRDLAVDSYVPLTKDAWIVAESDVELVTASTLELLGASAFWQNLDRFSAMALETVVEKSRQDDLIDGRRLQVKAENDLRSMENALRTLAEPARSNVVSGRIHGDPLLAAATVVGRAMNLPIIAPPASSLEMKWEDPVESIARASRARVRPVALRGKWWTLDSGPLLGYIGEDTTPVALLRTGGSYEVHYSGVKARVTAELASAISPTAYMFYRGFPAKKLGAADILKFSFQKDMIRDLAVIGAVGILGGILGMAIPLFTGVIFDTIIPSAERSRLVWIGLILFVTTLASFLFELTRSIAMLRIEGRMDSGIEAATWDRILSLPAPFFRNFSTGDLASRAASIGSIRTILAGSTAATVFTSVFSVFNFGLLFHYDTRLALTATVLTIIALVVGTLFGWLELRNQESLMKGDGLLSGLTMQLMGGIAKLRTSAAESRAYFVWAKVFGGQNARTLKSRGLTTWMSVFDSAYPLVTTVVIFSTLVRSSGARMSTGQFLAFNSAFVSFMGGMLGLSSTLLASASVVPTYRRAKPILDAIPETDEMKTDPGPLSGSLEVKGVTFKYHPDGPTILDDVTLEARPGEFIGIVGPSGSGKSTLLRMLLGFESPSVGAVYYDGQDLAGLDVQAVRRQIGVVLQSTKMMSGSILSNIIGVSARLTSDDAMEAVRMAGLDRDLEEMPMGLHTMVNEGATTLSGGQRQRLSIARAIVKKPRVILFDEATSALDNRTQKIVSESIDSLQATRIVIAHRLSTIINANRIYVLDHGRVIEHGSYDELMALDGMFASLAKRQMA